MTPNRFISWSVIAALAAATVFISLDCSKKTTKIPPVSKDHIAVDKIYYTTQPDPIQEQKIQAQTWNIFFGFDSSDVRQEHSQDILDVVFYFNNNPNCTLSIDGHADERGTDEYNMRLSQKRIESILKITRENGIHGLIKTAAYGESKPANLDCFSDPCWQGNRRVEIRVK